MLRALGNNLEISESKESLTEIVDIIRDTMSINTVFIHGNKLSVASNDKRASVVDLATL